MSLYSTMRSGMLGLAVGLGLCGLARAEVAPVHQGTAHDALFAVDFDGLHGLAVGFPSLVLETSDGGKTWAEVPGERPQVALLGVTVAGDRSIAVGQGGVVLVRAGAADWKAVDSATEQRLMSVDINTSGLAVAVGGFGTIILSADGGETWEPVTPDWTAIIPDGFEPHLYDVNVDESGGLTLVGEFELIMRSTDRGATWNVVRKGEASLFDLDVGPDGRAYVVGQNGTLLMASAIGATDWQPITSGVPSGNDVNLLGVWAGSKTVVVSGIRNLLVSQDAGSSFTKLTELDFLTGWYQGVAAPKDGAGAPVVVGHSGRIIKIER